MECGVRVPFPNYLTSPKDAEKIVRLYFRFPDISKKLEEGVLVDLGCGIGTVLAEIEKQHPNAKTIGVDQNHEYLEEARKIISGNLVKAMLEELPFDDGSVDVVFSRRIYVPFNEDCREITAEIHRILGPGGMYVADEAPWYHVHRDALKGFGMKVVRDLPLTLIKP